MRFSVTVEFTHMELARMPDALIAEGSEQHALATSVWAMTCRNGADTPEQDGAPFARLLASMAAQTKLTELRILHSILITYTRFIREVQVHDFRDFARDRHMYEIVVLFNTNEMVAVEAEIDGEKQFRTFRQIDMIDAPNYEGDKAPLDDAHKPKRRMNLRTAIDLKSTSKSTG